MALFLLAHSFGILSSSGTSLFFAIWTRSRQTSRTLERRLVEKGIHSHHSLFSAGGREEAFFFFAFFLCVD